MNLSRDKLDYSVYYFLICISGSWGSRSSKRWKMSCFFLKQSPHLKNRQTDFTHLSFNLQSWSAALSLSNMSLEILRNTQNFFKPLPSSKMSCYCTRRRTFLWLIHKYIILTWLQGMIFNRWSNSLLEEHSTALSLHLGCFTHTVNEWKRYFGWGSFTSCCTKWRKSQKISSI